MRGAEINLVDFWLTPWSNVIRAACPSIVEHSPAWGRPIKNSKAPWWVRPFFLHAWVVQAILARQAWLADHPGVPKDRFGANSETRWGAVTWTFAEGWCLREMEESTLLTCLLHDVERLLKIIEETPRIVGSAEWAQAVLVACGHFVQYYRELTRRHGVQQARQIIQTTLADFVTWQPEEAEAMPAPETPPDDPPATPAGTDAATLPGD